MAPPGVGAARQSTSYNMFAAGAGTIHLPLVESVGIDGWSTGEGIMNTGAATNTVSYFDTTTGMSVGTLQSLSLSERVLGPLPAGRWAAEWDARQRDRDRRNRR